MIKYRINDIEELNYSVCSFLLKNKVLAAKIHCSEWAILRSLRVYMIEIGIPFRLPPCRRARRGGWWPR